MSTPKVSIVVPVYNTEKFLKECIDSLTNQTLKEIEIIIVDDGSKPECALLCDEFSKNDDRVKVIHKVNEGQGIARNCGTEIATGEYITFLDSDDFVSLNMYESLYNTAKKYDADIVLSGVGYVGGNTFSNSGAIEEKHFFTEDTVFEKENINDLILGVVGAKPSEPDDSRYGVGVCKNIYRKSIMDNGVKFVSERKIISEDAIFTVDFLKAVNKAVGVHGVYYYYRRNDESFSKAYRSDRFEKILIFLQAIEDRISDIISKDEYNIYLKRLIQGYARILCSQEIMYAKEQGINNKNLFKRLKMICENDLVASTLKTYPWYKLPKKQAAFAFAMKYKLYLLQKIMVLFRAR